MPNITLSVAQSGMLYDKATSFSCNFTGLGVIVCAMVNDEGSGNNYLRVNGANVALWNSSLYYGSTAIKGQVYISKIVNLKSGDSIRMDCHGSSGYCYKFYAVCKVNLNY